jgi:hypothetical protein
MLAGGDFLMNTVSVRPLLLSEGAHAFQGYWPYGASGCNFPVSYGTKLFDIRLGYNQAIFICLLVSALSLERNDDESRI